jgi:hypothetical protein
MCLNQLSKSQTRSEWSKPNLVGRSNVQRLSDTGAQFQWHRCLPFIPLMKPKCRDQMTPVLNSSDTGVSPLFQVKAKMQSVQDTGASEFYTPVYLCNANGRRMIQSVQDTGAFKSFTPVSLPNAKKIKIQSHSDTGASIPLHRCHPFHRIPDTEHQRHRCLNTLTPVYLVRQNQTFALGWLTIGGSTCLKMCVKSWTKGISAWGKE